MSRLDIAVTYNFRPVAGTREGALYRADALSRVTREGRSRLRELGVSRVIDLRSDLDRRLGGGDRLRGVGTELVKIPMMSGTKKSEVYTLTLEGIYRGLLDRNGAEIGSVVRAVAESDGAVIVHCTAGKDRSGVVSALMQLAVGINEQTVLEDYSLTQTNLEGEWADRMLRKMRRFRIRVTPQLERVLVGSPVEALSSTLEYLDSEHGGIDAFLAGVGVSDAHRDQLSARLLG